MEAPSNRIDTALQQPQRGLDMLGERIRKMEHDMGSGSPTGRYLNSLAVKVKDKTTSPSPVATAMTGTASATEAEATSVVSEASSQSAKDPVEEPEAKSTSSPSSNPVAAKADAVLASGGGGTLSLDRPKPIQGVFEALQKQAVKTFKSTVPATSSAGGNSVSETAAQAALRVAAANAATATAKGGSALSPAELEAKLEGLLEGSKFSPAGLSVEGKGEMVAALEGLEGAYPADAAPLEDPCLGGEWSMAYSSSSKILRNALGKNRSRLFVVSDPRQTVNPKTSQVVNTCRVRLRLTPLGGRVAQVGTYSQVAAGAGHRAVKVEFGRGSWFQRLPLFRRAKVAAAEVTYLSGRWRVVRAGNNVLAFRKVDNE